MEERLRVFFAEVEFQKDLILKLHDKVFKKAEHYRKNPNSEELRDSLGYSLHNLYCAYEDLFTLVADYFENQIERDGRFHISLLKRMFISVEGVRPSLITERTFELLSELRAFRHIFRHSYTFELDGERVLNLALKISELRKLFLADLDSFIRKLRGKE